MGEERDKRKKLLSSISLLHLTHYPPLLTQYYYYNILCIGGRPVGHGVATSKDMYIFGQALVPNTGSHEQLVSRMDNTGDWWDVTEDWGFLVVTILLCPY